MGRFFHGSGLFRIGSGFLAEPDPDSEKNSEKNRIRNTARPHKNYFAVSDHLFVENISHQEVKESH